MGKKALAVELGEFVARLRFEDLPPAVVDKAKAVVNHAVTVAMAGYEVQCRCARDFIPSTPARGFRASPVYGILGCAATTAKLLGLDAARTASAIALAASFAGSLIEGQRTGARDADFAEAQAARS